jgi:hypothetical protein
MEYAKLLLDSITKASARRNGRALRRKERKLQRRIETEFDKQAKYVISRSAKLPSKGVKAQKGLEEDVDRIFDGLNDSKMIEGIEVAAEDSMKFGGDSRVKESSLGEIGLVFSVTHPLAVQYLEERALIWAKLSETTKDAIKPILIDAAATGQSPQKTAQIIREHHAFSRDRAMMISVNEIGHAYEYGNWMMMKQTADEGYDVKKQWSTVHDDRVTEECNAYERMGWIKFKKKFKAGGGNADDQAPRQLNPRCRCTTLYRYE